MVVAGLPKMAKKNTNNNNQSDTGKLTKVRICLGKRLQPKRANFSCVLAKDVRVRLGLDNAKSGEVDMSGYDSSDDEPEVYHEYDVDNAKEHNTLQLLAEQDIPMRHLTTNDNCDFVSIFIMWMREANLKIKWETIQFLFSEGTDEDVPC